ncbi:MAG TPA: NUDIX hydrolase [Clostridia bacterium]|nr:NUDIX hydrolase [Clostridia bacterium]
MVFPTHIVAVCGIIESNNEILLVNAYHGGWVPPGGQVEIGENLMDALKREIREECGVSVVVENLFFIGSNTCTYEGYNGVKMVPTKVVFGFICKYADGELRASEENSESRWIKKDKVLDMITDPSIRDRFQSYLDFNGSVQLYGIHNKTRV